MSGLPPLRDLLLDTFSGDGDLWMADPAEMDVLGGPHRAAPCGVGAFGGMGGYGGGGAALTGTHHLAGPSTALQLTRHPLWPGLVEVYFACVKATAFDAASIRAMNAERKELTEHAKEMNAMTASQQPYVMGSDVELDTFMHDYIRALEELKSDVESFVTTTEKVFSDFEQRITEIMPAVEGGSRGGAARQRGAHNGHSPAPGTAMAACAAAQAQSGSLIAEATGAAGKSGGLLGRDEEELLRQHLKRKHAASILSLKEEFLRKRKKGKLPKDATSALKTWWLSNLVWPYPTEDDKRTLGDETGLHPTQINNWFINQRKRHWHKLFPDGPPVNAEEAEAGMVKAYGSLDAALTVAGRA